MFVCVGGRALQLIDVQHKKPFAANVHYINRDLCHKAS